VFILAYYDIVSEGCDFSEDFQKRLGFSKVFSAGKDIGIYDADKKAGDCDGCIAYGSNASNMIHMVRSGAKAIMLKDFKIEKKLLEIAIENGCVLLVPFNGIISSYGFERSRNLFKASKFLSYATKKDAKISFISMASSKMGMCSYMQLVELAKMLGASEEEARDGISKTTKSVFDG
jgi:hypothetical protein